MAMSKTFVIADPHFYHDNIIKFDNRPFETIEEMNKSLIKRWNRVVNDIDCVYILGDFCWLTTGKEEYSELLQTLNGRKRFILGNHDPKDMNKELKRIGKVESIKDYEEVHFHDKLLILSHYPILFHKKAWSDKVYHFFGHVHSTIENDYIEQVRREVIRNKTEPGRAQAHWLNVGCMMPWMQYRPIEIKEAIKQTDKINLEVRKSL